MLGRPTDRSRVRGSMRGGKRARTAGPSTTARQCREAGPAVPWWSAEFATLQPHIAVAMAMRVLQLRCCPATQPGLVGRLFTRLTSINGSLSRAQRAGGRSQQLVAAAGVATDAAAAAARSSSSVPPAAAVRRTGCCTACMHPLWVVLCAGARLQPPLRFACQPQAWPAVSAAAARHPPLHGLLLRSTPFHSMPDGQV